MKRDKQYWDRFPHSDIELTVTAMGLNGVPTCKDDNGDTVFGVWPNIQHLPIEVGARYKARVYHLTGSATILTEKL